MTYFIFIIISIIFILHSIFCSYKKNEIAQIELIEIDAVYDEIFREFNRK